MIEYLQNTEVKALIDNATSYQKSAQTGLRKVKFTTYVKDGNSIRIESTPFLPGVVIARNPGIIGYKNGEEIYNEWPISLDVAIKNYGQDVVDSLSEEITFHKKKVFVQAIELTQEVMNLLNMKGDTLPIKVSWSPDPMQAKIGDFITSEGYSISAHDMASTYEAIVSNLDTKNKVKP